MAKGSQLNLIIINMIIIISAISAFAEENEEEKSLWEFTVGGKGVYSSGVSDANTYYKAFAGAGYDFEFLMISTAFSRYFNYQTTDGLGSYDNINYNEAVLLADFTPFDWFNLNLEGRYSRGDSGYAGIGYAAGISLDFNVISFLIDAGMTEYAYDFNGNVLNFENNNYSFEIDFSASESLSFDAGVSYGKMVFEDDYDYSKVIIRLGTIFENFNNFFLMAGGSAGKDSEEYGIWGFDSGFSWRIFDYIKLTALYSFQYYVAPDSNTAGQTETAVTKQNGPGPNTSGNNDTYDSYSTGGRNNPYLSSSQVGESYYSHIISVNVSCIF